MVAPVNDLFANATQVDILTPGTDYVSGLIECTDATTEVGEPSATTTDKYRSIWFKYTPAHGGAATLTKGRDGSFLGGYYNIMSVWTGSTLGSLILVDHSGTSETMTFDAAPGVTYYIRLAGRDYTGYSLQLTVDGETTVTSKVPAAPALKIVPENTDLFISWPVGYQTTWEIQKDADPIISLGAVGTHTFSGLTIGQTYTIKVRGTNSLGTGAWTTRTVLMPNMLVFDSFTRANHTSVVGAGEVGPAPVAALGTWGINAASAYSPVLSSNSAMLHWECATSNVDIRVKKTAGSLESGGIMFGYVSTTDYWYAFFSGVVGANQTHLAHMKGTVFQQLGTGKTGPDYVTQASVLRFVHHNGLYQMWADAHLLLEGRLPFVPTSTKHGIRGTATTLRWDDLTIRESSEITLDADGITTQPGRMIHPAEPVDVTGFLYKGRDTKAQDTAGVG